jgi:hypothetical protein
MFVDFEMRDKRDNDMEVIRDGNVPKIHEVILQYSGCLLRQFGLAIFSGISDVVADKIRW